MTQDTLIGQQLANFEVQRLLGRGGMAEVYYGMDVSLQRPVAIKVIDARFRADPTYAERFISEARAVATWRHENVVQVYYAGQQDDLFFFVMEYIDGLDLDSLLRDYAEAGELMPHEDVLRVGRSVAAALDYAHTQDVIHRDVKPANVMISRQDRVVLMDFGLALNTQQGSVGEVLGTPQYVSPEQARRSSDAVPQSDVYSFGVMLYEMLTGIVPFDDPSPTAVALQHLSMEPPSPRSLNRDLNAATEAVLLKALAKNANERYATATELIEALDTALSKGKDADPLATAELPPLPPGMVAPKRSVSNRTVTEWVALSVDERTVPAPPKPKTVQHVPSKKSRSATTAKPPANLTKQTQSSSGGRGWLIGIPVLLVVLAVGGYILLSSDNTNTAIPTAAPTIAAVEATSSVGQAAVQPTNPPTATTIPPTATATPIPPTATVIPPTTTAVTVLSPTPIPPTAAVLVATATTIPPTIPAAPTVLYPNGNTIQLLWNNESFYWFNPTGAGMRVSPIRFEALDTNGIPTGNAFEGLRWTIGFSSVESGKCVAIELLQTTDWLRPGTCSRGYNSQLTLQATDSQVFWRSGVAAQFRVLWNGEEVGRCIVANGSCEVRVP